MSTDPAAAPPSIIDAALAVARAIQDGVSVSATTSGSRIRAIRAAIRRDWPAMAWALNDLNTACQANPPAAQPGAQVPEHYRQNGDAVSNRNLKAARLADWGQAHGLTPAGLLAMELPVRRGIEREQGIRKCSDDETWPHAATLLGDRIAVANAQWEAEHGPRSFAP